MSDVIWKEQPPPVVNENPAVWDLVLNDLAHSTCEHPGQKMSMDLLIEDIKKRDQVGLQRYGTRLQAFNGRNALQDAYEEMLDAVVYLRQTLQEMVQTQALIITPKGEARRKTIETLYGQTLQMSMMTKFMLYTLEKEKNE